MAPSHTSEPPSYFMQTLHNRSAQWQAISAHTNAADRHPVSRLPRPPLAQMLSGITA
jgi:hypothetical protein